MLIKSLLKRAAGTQVTLRNEYHFKPQDTALKSGTDEYKVADHVCEVTDQQDLARLLSIPEGYALFLPEDKPAKKAAKAPEAPAAATAATAAAAGIVTTDPVLPNDDAPPAPPAPPANPDADAQKQEDAKFEDAELSALKAKFEELAGKKPHYKWTAERIATEIADLEAAK